MTGVLAWKGGSQETLLLSGGRVVDPRTDTDAVMDVLVDAGRIAQIAKVGSIEGGQGAEVIDCRGFIVMPAFTDPHVHLRTPGQEHKETLATGTAAGAAGGYCQLLAMPNTTPPIDGPEILRGVLARCSEEAVIPTGQLGAITKGLGSSELTEMSAMSAAGAAGFTDDGLPVSDAGVLRRALRYQSLVGALIALHEEDPSLSMGAPLNEGLVSARRGLRGQPALAESTMIERDCALAELEGARIHLQHLSCGRSVEAVARAKARGVAVTAEASPHHLLMTEEACDTLDTRTKMNPPLRFEEDRLALIAGLSEGTIDCVATDHAPHSADEKSEPFGDAPFGVTGLETSFAMLHQELVTTGSLELRTLVERMTAGCVPFGFDAPTIAKDAPANIAIFDPAAQWSVGEDGYVSRSANSSFAGRNIVGRICLTIALGVVVHRSGTTEASNS